MEGKKKGKDFIRSLQDGRIAHDPSSAKSAGLGARSCQCQAYGHRCQNCMGFQICKGVPLAYLAGTQVESGSPVLFKI